MKSCAIALLVRFGLLAFSLSACLSPVRDGPPDPTLLSDGGLELVCGDGGMYGLAYEQNQSVVQQRRGAPPAFSEGCTVIRGSLLLAGELDFAPYRNVQVIEGRLIIGDATDAIERESSPCPSGVTA